METVHHERDKNQLDDSRRSNESPGNSSTPIKSTTNSLNTSNDEPSGSGNLLFTHDGVLLKGASAENKAHLNTSGSISLLEFNAPRRLFIEWRPNDSILIADDSVAPGDWSLVDTISKRTRTSSECKSFNTSPKPTENGNKRHMRTNLEYISKIEVRHRGQTLRLIRKKDGYVHSEYFFQHGNAEPFVRSMRTSHVIDYVSSSRYCEEYIILTSESQKLKKTFAELDIGEIKASSLENESWLRSKLTGFLINFPDYVSPTFQKSRPSTLERRERQKSGSSNDSYQIINHSELENVKEDDEKIVNNLPERPIVVRGAPLNETQWLEFRTIEGRKSDPARVKEIIFRGGISNSLRAEVWKYLLNYYQWNDTEIERIQRRKEKSKEYYSMKAQWLSISIKQEENFIGYRERKSQIEKDVKRTDRSLEYFAGEDNPNLFILQGILMTYVMYNFDLGYVQGMSDLLAPILAIQESEVDAFWCFVGFMDVVFANFDIDQAGMKSQFQQLRLLLEFVNPRLFNYMVTHESDDMYCCFRWLLVWFKREFSNEDIFKLWECLWTGLPCPNFHIFISVAILDQQTDVIIDNKYEFSAILKHVNELSGNIDLKRTLEIAEAIYLQIKEAKFLPNDIREIIGEPLIETNDDSNPSNKSHDFEDNFDELYCEAAFERGLLLSHN